MFNKLFFPSFDPVTGTLLSLATFTAGFVVRPLGAIVFGHFGDRVGRKQALTISLLIVGAATFLIGLLPTYASIGVLAPILLVVLRMAQGFALGGEWGGAVLISMEHGPQDRRGLYATGPQIGVPIGNLLSAGVFALLVAVLSEEQLLAWGWRVPFLLSGILLGVGLCVRMALEESPVFVKASERQEIVKQPVIETVRNYPKPLLLAIGARLGSDVAYYIFAVFILVYGTEELGLSRGEVLNGILIGSAIQLFLIPWAGCAVGPGRPPADLHDRDRRGRRLGVRVLPADGHQADRLGVRGGGGRLHRPCRDVRRAVVVHRGAVPGEGPLHRRLARLAVREHHRRRPRADHRRGAAVETGGTLAVSLYTVAALAVTFACALIARETAGRDAGRLRGAGAGRATRKPLFVRGEEAERVEAGDRT